MAATPHEGSSPARTGTPAASFWRQPVGLVGGGEQPQWVVVLAGVATGFGLIAVDSHGTGHLLAWLVVLACLGVLLLRRGSGVHR